MDQLPRQECLALLLYDAVDVPRTQGAFCGRAGTGSAGTGLRHGSRCLGPCTRCAVCATPNRSTPPPPCASTALSKHGVGVEPLFLGIFGTTVFVVPNVTWGLDTLYHTLPTDDVCFDVILSHSCYFPSTAYRHLHLRALLDVGSHVCLPSCVPHAGTVLFKHGVGVEPLFCLVFWDHGRACATGGRGTSPRPCPPSGPPILSKPLPPPQS